MSLQKVSSLELNRAHSATIGIWYIYHRRLPSKISTNVLLSDLELKYLEARAKIPMEVMSWEQKVAHVHLNQVKINSTSPCYTFMQPRPWIITKDRNKKEKENEKRRVKGSKCFTALFMNKIYNSNLLIWHLRVRLANKQRKKEKAKGKQSSRNVTLKCHSKDLIITKSKPTKERKKGKERF